jgi:cytochrome o ubiquinol oxidase subunit II
MSIELAGPPNGREYARHAWSPYRRAARGTLIATPVILTACQPAVLDPQGVVGIAERTILIDSLAIMLAIVLPTIAATFAFAWWFRASNTKATYLPEFEYSGRLEFIVWSIPLLTITLLGGVAWVGSHALDPAQPLPSDKPPLDIQAVSMDWKWLFIYPDQHIASVNQLVIPAGTPVHFALTSASVMNTFFIAQLGSMIYTMNGMITQLHLQADRAGDYNGLSAQFSGDGFPDMKFVVHAVPQNGFAEWVAGVRRTGPALDRAGYADLAKQSTAQPFTFSQIDPALFNAVVTQQIPPQPGPGSQRAEKAEH